MHAEPGAPPPVLSHEVVPGRGRGPDLPEPLREDGERAGRDVSELRRGHHVLDHPDFRWRQPMRRCAGTGQLIVQRTRVLPSPGMEPTRRQAEEPEKRPQRDAPAGPIDSAQDPHLGASVRQPRARQREPRGPQQRQHELQQRGELLDTSPREPRARRSTSHVVCQTLGPSSTRYGSVKATNSAGSPRALIAIAMYCFPSAI